MSLCICVTLPLCFTYDCKFYCTLFCMGSGMCNLAPWVCPLLQRIYWGPRYPRWPAVGRHLRGGGRLRGRRKLQDLCFFGCRHPGAEFLPLLTWKFKCQLLLPDYGYGYGQDVINSSPAYYMIRRLFEALRYSGDRDCEEDDSFKNVQPSCPTFLDIDKVDINQTWMFSALKYGFNLVPTQLCHPFKPFSKTVSLVTLCYFNSFCFDWHNKSTPISELAIWRSYKVSKSFKMFEQFILFHTHFKLILIVKIQPLLMLKILSNTCYQLEKWIDHQHDTPEHSLPCIY